MRTPLVLAAATALLAAGAAEARVDLRLATVAPSGSAWHVILQKMGAGVGRDTGGEVRIRIIAGGSAGDESDMIRKMRIGQVQMAALSNAGLAELDRSAWTLSIPMVFRDYDEWDHVRQEMNPTIDAKLAELGFDVLGWADVGWAHFFASSPVETLADLQGLRLAASATDATAVDLLRWAGFDPVPINTIEMLSGFQTGLIEAAALPVILAESSQLYRSTPYMNDLKWAPLQAALIIHERGLERLTPEQQGVLRRHTTAAAEEFRGTNRKQELASLSAMERRGLSVIEASPAFEEAWLEAARQVWPRVREELVPGPVFDEVLRLRDEYRASQP